MQFFFPPMHADYNPSSETAVSDYIASSALDLVTVTSPTCADVYPTYADVYTTHTTSTYADVFTTSTYADVYPTYTTYTTYTTSTYADVYTTYFQLSTSEFQREYKTKIHLFKPCTFLTLISRSMLAFIIYQ